MNSDICETRTRGSQRNRPKSPGKRPPDETRGRDIQSRKKTSLIWECAEGPEYISLS